jgi:hypothetical protein
MAMAMGSGTEGNQAALPGRHERPGVARSGPIFVMGLKCGKRIKELARR